MSSEFRVPFDIDWDTLLPKCHFKNLKKVKEFIFMARIKLDTPDDFTGSIYSDLCKAEEKVNKLLREGLEAYKARQGVNDVC